MGRSVRYHPYFDADVLFSAAYRGDVVAEAPVSEWPRYGLLLPHKDVPILAAAVHAGASHLLTGDVRHFGVLFERKIGNVTILLPAQYLRDRDTRAGAR